MGHLALVSAGTPQVTYTVKSILEGTPISSQSDLARCLFWWVKKNIQFVEDEELLNQELGYGALELDKELLISPPVLLSMPSPMGDCDDFSTLLASLLLACEIKCSFVTVAADGMDPYKFSHVYVRAYPNDGEAIYLDTSHGPYPGWETSRQFRKQEWPL